MADWLRFRLSTGALCMVYVLFVYAHLAALGRDGFRLSLALIVVFESVMVVLVFFRRSSTRTDMSAPAVVAGLVGSFAALALRPAGGAQDVVGGQVLQVVGAALQLGCSFSIGRSFGVVPANRGVKTAGLYRLVRHPFYLSYLVSQIGYIISNPSTRNGAVVVVGTAFQVVRIHYEERLLWDDCHYRAYAESVRWHLIPGVW